MKYSGWANTMWIVFGSSFKKQLREVLNYDSQEAEAIYTKAKEKYPELIEKLPEFEKEDAFKMNIVSCAMACAFFLSMPKKPDVREATEYYNKAMMTPLMHLFCRISAASKFTSKDIEGLRKTEKLKAAERNPYSWNMELYEYEDGSGYEARFTKCGICTLMKECGLYELTPALCALDYAMSEAGGRSKFVREHTLAGGGPYCDCGYYDKKKIREQ